jgi:hypothetical protein
MFRPKHYRTRLFDPLNAPDEETDECTEHIFMPIDSDGQTLACRNCGLVVNKEDLHKY